MSTAEYLAAHSGMVAAGKWEKNNGSENNADQA
jgi:hypothetical protein